ncbi:Protein EXECUTER 2, chloroplastic [Zea mays]|uniref:Protein EXECUTER 2, chloroplastic n=1 Tax=Zea mays TaxID=4577 RepID=A0A3L6EP69_MAIZE|nr:Protein EXECUTER 2, chloroplastic [Zea mays]
MDEESKSTKVKLFISGVVHNKEDARTKSYVHVPAEINNMEKDSFELYIPGNGSGHDLPETKAAKQKVADMAAKLASELMPSDVAKALWGTTKSSSKINKEVQELLRLTLSKARVKLADNTFFNRIIMDTNSMDPFNGLYVGAFSPYGPEIVQLHWKFGHWNSSDDVEFFEYAEAVKLTGDLSVPAGQITFCAKIGKGKRLEIGARIQRNSIASYKGQGRIAQPGFKNPRWVDGMTNHITGDKAKDRSLGECSLCYSALHMLKGYLYSDSPNLKLHACEGFSNIIGTLPRFEMYKGTLPCRTEIAAVVSTTVALCRRLKPYEPWADGMWPAWKPDAPEVPEAPRATGQRTRMEEVGNPIIPTLPCEGSWGINRGVGRRKGGEVKEVFDAIAPVVGLSVGSAVGQSSIADEVSSLVQKPRQEFYPTIDKEYVQMEPRTKIDILVATPGRLMDHINMTNGFSLEHLQYLICKSNLKPLSLIVLLQELQGNKCLVFTSSVESSHRLSTLLRFFENLPFKFSEYSRLQRESTRRKTLEAFKEGKIDVLIGTDRMARGIHIDGLRYVINYDMPPYVKTYIHRAGRTARAGESGSCFTFLRKHEVKTFDKMLKKADNAGCNLHSLPEESIETLRPAFSGALRKLEGALESEAVKKYDLGDKTPGASKRKRPNQLCKQ